jgi:hypothetical protein
MMEEDNSRIAADNYIYVSRATDLDGLIVNRSDAVLEVPGLSMPFSGIGDDLRDTLLANSRALEGDEYLAPQEIYETVGLNTSAAQARRLGLADVQTFWTFNQYHPREGVVQAYIKYHNQRCDQIDENWRRIGNANAAVNLIGRGMVVGVQAVFNPVATLAPLAVGYGTEKVLTTAGVDPDTAAMVGHLAGSAVGIGTGLRIDPVGTAVSLGASDATTLVLRATGASDEDAALLGDTVGTMVGAASTFAAARRTPRQEILNAQRSWRTESDAASLGAVGLDFENSRGVLISDGVTLFRRLPPGARFARPAGVAPGVFGAPATPLALPPGTASPASGGVPAIAGRDYYVPGEYAVVPYEQTATSSPLQRMFDGDFTPRPRLVSFASSGDGGFTGGGGPGGPQTPSALVLPRSGQLLLAAGRQRGALIGPGPSEKAITLGPGRLGLDRLGSKAIRRQVEPWVNAVLSNRPFSWESIGLGWLNDHEQEVVRIRSLDLGLVPRIPVDPVTRYADFSSVLIEERTLPEELWQLGDEEQFRYLNDLIGGKDPGMTWHHHELPGWMQLLPFGPHNITVHFGGRSSGHWASGNR